MMLSKLLKQRPTTFLRCFRHHSTSPGPNEELIQMLTRYMEDEKASASSNAYKVRAYSKAISAIGQLSEQVRSVDQVSNLRGIGARIAKRIDAYLCGMPYEPPTSSKPTKARHSDHSHTQTKSQKTLDELRREQVVSSLSSINGVGPSKASALYHAGCTSLQDLKEPKFFQLLTRPQQVHVQYMIDHDRRVTREQAFAVRDFVTQNISSKFTVLLAGDFRRGTASAQHLTLVALQPQTSDVFPPQGSPSIDSTIKPRGKYHDIPSPFASHPETKVKSKGLPDTAIFSTEIISPLECRGLIATTLSAGAQKWHGIIRIPERVESRVERLHAVQERQGQFFDAEIYFVPEQCAGAALITLTGDLGFNIAIRKAASQLGLRLNEYGLWQWQNAGADAVEQDGGHWELIASEKEEDILAAVRMEWVAPERRNFANLNGRSRGRKRKE